MRYFSLFSGIGGFELGIQHAYRLTGHGQPHCVGFSEIDRHTASAYQYHFPEHAPYGDCTRIDPNDIPDFDLPVGGFSCQAFSISGKRRGFLDARGTLFYQIARIARHTRPAYLFLENVKGLLSHAEGDTFGVILETLDELGYDLQWQVLNSKDFGVPQNRERVFLIGHLRRSRRPEIFPFGSHDETSIHSQDGAKSKTKPASAITTREGGRKENNFIIEQLNQPKHSNDRVYGAEGISPTLNTMQGGNRQPFVASVLTPDRPNKRQNGRRFKENGDPSFTLTAHDKHGVMIGSTQKNTAIMKNQSPALTEAMGKGGGHVPMRIENNKIRRLTPTECERLQGFPDGWTEYGLDNQGGKTRVSDSQRYKVIGNAVPVPVITAIARRLIESPCRDRFQEPLTPELPNIPSEKMSRGAAWTHMMRFDQTQRNIEQAIDSLKRSNKRITKTNVARLVGISREHISRRYGHLFDNKP